MVEKFRYCSWMRVRTPDNSVDARCAMSCALLVLGVIACSSDPPGGPSSGGPPDAMLEFDANAIGGATSTGGVGAFGGFGAVGGMAGTGGNGATGGFGGSAGTGGSSAYCDGTPTPCSILTDTQCPTATGCSLKGDCKGVSSSCYSQFSHFSCISQQGCIWSSSSKKCSGSAWSCGLMSGSSSCFSQKGCSSVRW